jgi:7,8-dihydropterin-6-yl-methyl-4-(beta-D-ribofuranosyl)aminobenzene 5'-phosphate synthase
MSDPILLTVLVENSTYGRDLRAEHGLAVHLKTGPHSFLFDTGQSDLLVHNARLLGVNLSPLDAIVLSHGHYDHTGGLGAVRDLAPRAALYAHPAAWGPHLARHPDGSTCDVGMAPRSREAVRAFETRRYDTVAKTEVAPGLFLTGEIPRETDFEDVGGPFVLDAAGRQPDPIADDQALFFDTRDGVVVLLGCAHAGVVNTLRHVRRLTSARPLHAVLGGMHLLAASPERMERTMEALRELGVQRLGPAHCTGMAATARLWNAFPGACAVCAVGSRLVFPR